MGIAFYRFAYELTEQRICPGEPRSGEQGRIISIVGFMHKAGTGGGRLQYLNCSSDLIARVAGQCIDDLRHGPYAIAANMGPPDSFARASSEKPRVLRTPYEASGSRIERSIG